MENGYKNWPIVRKMLIDNRLEHAALLAYSIGVPESLFARRALTAYRKIEVRVGDAVEVANDTMSTVANALADEEDKAATIRERAEAVAARKAAGEPSPIDPEGAGAPVVPPPEVAVTLDRVTDEPPKEG